MSRATFSQSLVDARLMSDALKAHAEELAKVGLAESTAVSLRECIDELSILDTQQEKLKADLKATTAKIVDVSKKMESDMQDCRKRVKLAIPQAQWKEFGLTATR